MAEKNYNNILNDPETSDEEEYSGDDDLESEGESLISECEDLDEDPDIIQTAPTSRKRPRVSDEHEQQNSESEGEPEDRNLQVRRGRSREKPPSQTRGSSRSRDRGHKSDSEDSEVASEAENIPERRSKSRSTSREDRHAGRPVSIVKGKGDNPIKRSLKKPSRHTRSQSVPCLHLPSVIGEARNAETPLAAWSYLMSNDIIGMVILHTNEEIVKVVRNLENRQTYHKETDDIEIRALIGLLYMAGYNKQSQIDIDDLWGEEFAPNVYRATMSAQRFKFLITCLRFDDKTTRVRRRQYDRFAAIRDIWTKFLDNCTAYYSPYQICTIDKQMIGFKGKCKFCIYLPSKPDRYGIKFMMINDAKTSYMFNAVPYLGKITDNALNEPVANYFVRKLVKSIRGSGRTVVMDNWFTSVNLFQILDTEYGLKALGIIEKTKKEIPELFLEKAPVKMTRYDFSDKLSLHSYTPKRSKILLLLANGHTSTGSDSSTGKSQLVTQYNANKGATDAFDEACKLYTVARKTRHWPLKVFYGILDKASVNSTIIYNLLHLEEKKARKIFQKELSFALIKPQLERRYKCQQLRTPIRRSLAALLEIPQPPVQYENVIELDKRVRCSYCHYSLGIKTKMQCPSCQKAMCARHRCPLCTECAHMHD